MANILTSWKEIGHYLGKGVRTVQRWEREAGLPVRRQTTPSPHAVIAISEELDGWARSRTRGPSGALAGALQREIDVLHEENAELRARLDVLEAAMLEMSTTEVRFTYDRLSPAMRLKLEENAWAGLEGRTIPAPSLPDLSGGPHSTSLRIHFAAQKCRAEAVRAQLSFAFTLCAVGAGRTRGGDPGVLRKAQNAALETRRRLMRPGFVPQNELDDLHNLLAQLALKIELLTQASPFGPDAVVT
jgi:hypothetical protein